MPKIPDRSPYTKMFTATYRYRTDTGWFADSWTFQARNMERALCVAREWLETNDWDTYEIISIVQIDIGE